LARTEEDQSLAFEQGGFDLALEEARNMHNSAGQPAEFGITLPVSQQNALPYGGFPPPATSPPPNLRSSPNPRSPPANQLRHMAEFKPANDRPLILLACFADGAS
jgi:hypothetical protein